MFDIVIDRVSFWIGVAAGMVLAALWKRLAPVLGNIRAGIGARMQSLQAGLSTSIEKRYRLDIVRMAQDNHLAAALFSLDEIAIPPRLMAPPVPVIPGEDPPPADVYSMTIPYMPDWPELAACYNAPTLGFKDALAGGANLMVMGKPGSGKTFALNYFAAQVARRDPELDELGDLVPVLVHAADIVLPAKENKLTDVFYGAMNEKVSTLVEAKLSSFLNAIFEQELALLIVDGMDEMTQEGQTPIMEFLAEVAEKYPKNRMIVAASMENLPDHEGLGLTAIGLAGWTLRESSKFLSKWGELWDEFVVEESWARNLPEGIDRILLNGWLAKDIGASNPLDLTLKVWAAYAGDTLGASSEDNLEAFVRRMTGDVENSRLAIEQLAAQMVATLSPVLPRNQAGKFVAQFEDPEAPSDLDPEYIKSLEQMDDIEEGEEEELEVEKKKRGKGFSARKVRRMLPEMVKSNILTYRTSAKIGFMHPVICGYLAGCGLAEKGNPLEILSQPNWEGKNNALKYMVPKRDMTPVANTLLERQRHDAVRKDLFAIAKWPNHGAYGAPWKIHVMRELATLIRDNGYSLGLRGRAIAALASSGDENVSTLFRQLLISQHAEVRHLGALGCGLVQDEKAVRDLGSLLYDV
ncbi:MAG: NACHT domain-containing protein, partial [Anaerolineae bacterium]|nr:NACHT domain-containing protein [Anaerolineae bacterium]